MDLPPDIAVLRRGWLDGNVVLLRGDAPVLVDTGYHAGAPVLLDWLAEQGAAPPAEVVLTHVHSDHAGGVAALQARWPDLPVRAHPDAVALTDPWDPAGLWLGDTGQVMPLFRVTGSFSPGEVLRLAGREWVVVDTPGHATGGVAFYRPDDRVLLSGDALWEDGLGLLNVWTEPPGVFARTAAALDAIAALDVALVIPGHGAPFTDVAGALARARSRLAARAADPAKNLRHALKSAVGFARLAHPDWSEAQVVGLLRSLGRRWGAPAEDLAGGAR